MAKMSVESLACLLTILAIFSVAVSIDDKCAACNAVAVNPKPQLHVQCFDHNRSMDWLSRLLPDYHCCRDGILQEELEIGLSNEKPRNHLDMRHRLDSKGQRKGKVIDYRVSELRVVELLDGLCEKMQDYTLKKIDTTKQEWVKVDDWDNVTSDKQEARAYSKDISAYCGRLLEETEDELAELIKKGHVKVGEVNQVLCRELSQHCSNTRGYRETSINSDDDDEREL